MKFKYWELEIDGPDKTGKDLLCRYLCELSHWRFSINVRGLISQLVYAKKYKRDFEYDLESYSKDKVLILLKADSKDLAVRCKMTNEPVYNFEDDSELFDDAARELIEAGYKVLMYDSSHITPYEIARDVIQTINTLEEEHGKIL